MRAWRALMVLLLAVHTAHADCSFEASSDRSYSGVYREMLTRVTLSDCKQACLQARRYECLSFDFWPRNRKCKLFSAAGALHYRRRVDHYVKTCGPVCEYERQADKQVMTFDETVHDGVSLDTCMDRCTQSASCNSLDYKEVSRRCSLYPAAAPRTVYSGFGDHYRKLCRAWSGGTSSPLAECPAGWSATRQGCYQLSSDTRMWLSASSACGRLGGALLQVDGPEELGAVTELVERSGYSGEWWTAAENRFRQWVWNVGGFDYPEMSYSPWLGGEPGRHDHASLSRRQGRWGLAGRASHDSLRYVCERRP